MSTSIIRNQLAADLGGVGAGDHVALRRVYDATLPKLYGICLHILRDRSEAEDALQETFLNVWRSARTYDPDRGVSPITWLAALARNRSIDRLRSGRLRAVQPLEAAAEVPDPGYTPAETSEHRRSALQLASCLDQLEPAQAEAIRGAYFGGLTHVALAQNVGVPLGTMKSRIRRSLLQLRAALEEAP